MSSKSIGARVSTEHYERILSFCSGRGTTVSEFIVKCVDKAMEEEAYLPSEMEHAIEEAVARKELAYDGRRDFIKHAVRELLFRVMRH